MHLSKIYNYQRSVGRAIDQAVDESENSKMYSRWPFAWQKLTMGLRRIHTTYRTVEDLDLLQKDLRDLADDIARGLREGSPLFFEQLAVLDIVQDAIDKARE